MTENTTLSDVVTELSTAVVENDDNVKVNDDLKYIVVPLAVIASVMLLSALVFLMARKRRYDILKHRLMPMYNFEKENESDWETEFLNSVDNPNYTADYCTTKFMHYED